MFPTKTDVSVPKSLMISIIRYELTHIDKNMDLALGNLVFILIIASAHCSSTSSTSAKTDITCNTTDANTAWKLTSPDGLTEHLDDITIVISKSAPGTYTCMDANNNTISSKTVIGKPKILVF